MICKMNVDVMYDRRPNPPPLPHLTSNLTHRSDGKALEHQQRSLMACLSAVNVNNIMSIYVF